MPQTYRVTDPVTGVTLDLQGDSPPTETELAEIFKQYEKPAVMEIPQRRQAQPFMGVGREVAPAMELLSPEQKQEVLKTGALTAASLGAGPLVGTGLRMAGARAAMPAVEQFGRAVSSGGLATGLNLPQKVIGGGISGAAGTAVVSPEDIETGAAIGVVTPGMAKLARPFMRPSGPTTKEVLEAADTEYAAMRRLNESVSSDQFKALKSSLQDSATAKQYLPSKHTVLAKAFNILDEQARLGQPVSVDRLDKLRKVVARAANSADKEERDLAQELVKQFDAFVNQLAPESAAHLAAGRTFVTQKSRSKIVDDIIEKSRKIKGAEPSEVIKNEFYKISRGQTKESAKKLRQFTEEEQAVIKAIGEGRADINTLQVIGALFAPPRVLKPSLEEGARALSKIPIYGLGSGGVGATLGAPAAAMVAGTAAGTGFLSRAAANRLAQMRAAQFGAQVAAGGRAPAIFAPETFSQLYPASMAPINFLAEQQRLAEQGY